MKNESILQTDFPRLLCCPIIDVGANNLWDAIPTYLTVRATPHGVGACMFSMSMRYLFTLCTIIMNYEYKMKNFNQWKRTLCKNILTSGVFYTTFTPMVLAIGVVRFES